MSAVSHVADLQHGRGTQLGLQIQTILIGVRSTPMRIDDNNVAQQIPDGQQSVCSKIEIAWRIPRGERVDYSGCLKGMRQETLRTIRIGRRIEEKVGAEAKGSWPLNWRLSQPSRCRRTRQIRHAAAIFGCCAAPTAKLNRGAKLLSSGKFVPCGAPASPGKSMPTGALGNMVDRWPGTIEYRRFCVSVFGVLYS